MLAAPATICDSITNSAVFESWSHVETAYASQVVVEVCACVTHAVDRRRAVKDSQEQRYAVGGIRPSSGNSASWSGVRISNIVEEGRVECVPVSALAIIVPGPAICMFLRGSPRRGKIVEALWKDASKLPVPLHHPNSIVWLRNWVLVLLWTASNPARNYGAVDETDEPLLFFRVDCDNCCYFVSIFEKCSASSYLLLFVVVCSMNLFCIFLVVYIDIYVVE